MYVRDVFWSRPGLILRTSDMLLAVSQALICVRQRCFLEKARFLSAYVRYVFWSRPGFFLHTSDMFSKVDQALIWIRERCFLE